MSARGNDRVQTIEKARLAAVASLLGAPSTLRRVPQSPLEAHEMLLNGLLSRALFHLVQNLVFLRWDDSFARGLNRVKHPSGGGSRDRFGVDVVGHVSVTMTHCGTDEAESILVQDS